MALKLPKILDKKDVLRILSKINRKCPTGCRNYALLLMLYRAGLRISEACNLALPDVNLETGLIYVQQGKGKKDRYIPMDSGIIQSCKSWLAIRPQSEYFFCTLDGGRLDPRYVREVCYRLSNKAGVFIQDGREKKVPSPHKLRHTYATELLKEGFNPREVQELLGHSSLSTTMIYTHVVMDELTEKIKNRPATSQT